jgi:hypothetical protein
MLFEKMAALIGEHCYDRSGRVLHMELSRFHHSLFPYFFFEGCPKEEKVPCQVTRPLMRTLAEQLAKLPVVIFGDWDILRGDGRVDASDY